MIKSAFLLLILRFWGQSEGREERREVKSMKGEKKVNAIRSGIVVIGALAFGYLTLQIGFKPFLLKAQQDQEQQQQSLHNGGRRK
uniref:Uncharacterized protein n=1 Tax=Salix viminalis TaxID=40686 RepID=A0A6N2M5R7_SALVM